MIWIKKMVHLLVQKTNLVKVDDTGAQAAANYVCRLLFCVLYLSYFISFRIYNNNS